MNGTTLSLIVAAAVVLIAIVSYYFGWPEMVWGEKKDHFNYQYGHTADMVHGRKIFSRDWPNTGAQEKCVFYCQSNPLGHELCMERCNVSGIPPH